MEQEDPAENVDPKAVGYSRRSYKNLATALENPNTQAAIRTLWDQGIVGADFATTRQSTYATDLPTRIEQTVLQHTQGVVEEIQRLDQAYQQLLGRAKTVNAAVEGMKQILQQQPGGASPPVAGSGPERGFPEPL